MGSGGLDDHTYVEKATGVPSHIRNGGPERKSYLESFSTVIYGRHPWAICSISDVSNLDHTKHLMLIYEDCQISS